MLKRIFFVSLFIFYLGGCYPYLYAQKDNLNVNEELIFSINYRGFPVGKNIMLWQDIVTSNYEQAYALRTTTKSLPFFSLFFKVDDIIESIVSVNNLQPYRFEKHLREGNYKKDEIATFDYQKNLAYTNQCSVKIPENIYDPLSALYYLRTQELKIGSSVFLNVISNKKIYKLEIEVLKKENLDTIFGKIETIVIKPKMMFEGIFKHRGDILIWLTNDSYKFPVLVKSKIILGSICAVLIKLKKISLARENK